DLKPGNFLLHTDGRLMLADFGIARIIHAHGRMNGLTLTSPGVLLGTPNYMAPEMANGEPIDQRTDIYELGIVLFQMLLGEVPFQGTPYSVLIQHLEKPLPLLHRINPVIPPAVDDVIQKATAKKREDRFTSVGEMARALQTAITRSYYTFADSLPYSPSAPTVSIEPPHPNYQPSSALANETQAAKTVETSFARNNLYNGQPQKPQSPITKSRGGFTKTWSMFVGICLVAISALILSGVYIVNAQLGGKSGVSQTPTPTPAPEVQAKAAVQEFYNDLDQWKYTAAYKLAGGDYCGFVQGYAHTMHDKATLGSVTPVGDNTYSVATTLTATELLSKETVVSTYQGTQLVKKESDGTWKIVHGGNLPLISRVLTSSVLPLAAPGALPTQQAQAVIQQFYTYINQGNYVGAYNLWESANQDSPPFCNFLNGYAQTRHVNITFTSLTPQADGTVVVAFTTYATNDNSPTTQVNSASNVVEYDRYGMWKIKS
ncbi:MAG: serine/threonine protein kinase, partial [Chloroflexi bacterium]|nr:serine/threonine protein kinase [Chloroflexota bacterium]